MTKDNKAVELRKLSKADLLKKLDEQKKELAQLRVVQVTGGPSARRAAIGVARKTIARILTVYSQQQKSALREKFGKGKYVPTDLRPKRTRALRHALSSTDATRKTKKQQTKESNFAPRRFAVKA